MRRRIRERDSKMDGKTRVCGLIANPVEHSMSPLMHNFYARRTGVNLAYVPFKVENEQVGDAVKMCIRDSRYGYHRYQTDMMMVTVVLLIIIVQLIQEVFMRMSRRGDKRVR